MTEKVKKVLLAWDASISNYGKLDYWKIDEDLSILEEYLKQEDKESNLITRLVHIIRDRAVSLYELNPANTARYIKKALSLLEEKDVEMIETMKKVKKNRKDSFSQRRRFKGVTQRIFNEKLRFKDGMLLRNFDIDTETASDSRKVRRIIE